jgi:hypothetical protein
MSIAFTCVSYHDIQTTGLGLDFCDSLIISGIVRRDELHDVQPPGVCGLQGFELRRSIGIACSREHNGVATSYQGGDDTQPYREKESIRHAIRTQSEKGEHTNATICPRDKVYSRGHTTARRGWRCV